MIKGTYLLVWNLHAQAIMALLLKLSRWLSKQWKVKIRDRERVEPPHVSILRRRSTWRINLRTHEFKDSEPDPSEVPKSILKIVEENWSLLRAAWDEMYPENPVVSPEDEDE
jgi:hypothetical protein